MTDLIALGLITIDRRELGPVKGMESVLLASDG
jgi:hypothetical protein